MSEFDIEAARKLVADIGLHPAARHYGLNRATLYSRIKAHEAKQARASQPKAEPQPVQQTESEAAPTEEPSYSTKAIMRRHENENRKHLGLPPLTDAQADAEWQKFEQSKQAMAELMPDWKQP